MQAILTGIRSVLFYTLLGIRPVFQLVGRLLIGITTLIAVVMTALFFFSDEIHLRHLLIWILPILFTFLSYNYDRILLWLKADDGTGLILG